MTGQGKRVGVPPHSKKKRSQSQSKENRKVSWTLCLVSRNEGEVCGPRFLGSVGIFTLPVPFPCIFLSHGPQTTWELIIKKSKFWLRRLALGPEVCISFQLLATLVLRIQRPLLSGWGRGWTNRVSCVRESSVSLSILHPLYRFIRCQLESAYPAHYLWKLSLLKHCGD